MAPNKPGVNMVAKHESEIVVTTDPVCERVGMKKMIFTDPDGKTREWDAAYRPTTKGPVDAALIRNIFTGKGKEPHMMLVIQYRPPHKKPAIEWPAGLIDPGETANQAGLREFKEETGYEGVQCQVTDPSPVLAADPGMTTATLNLVKMQVKIKDDEKMPREQQDMPKQKLEADEHIQRVLVPLSQLLTTLESYKNDDGDDGYIVDSRLYSWADGYDAGYKQAIEDLATHDK